MGNTESKEAWQIYWTASRIRETTRKRSHYLYIKSYKSIYFYIFQWSFHQTSADKEFRVSEHVCTKLIPISSLIKKQFHKRKTLSFYHTSRDSLSKHTKPNLITCHICSQPITIMIQHKINVVHLRDPNLFPMAIFLSTFHPRSIILWSIRCTQSISRLCKS